MGRVNTNLETDAGVRRLTNTLQDGPLVIRGLFSTSTHTEICRFLDQRVSVMSMGAPIGVDNNDFIRMYVHNAPFFVKIHHQLVDFASELFGQPVKPSYNFLSMYQDQGICPLHVDRPQCRFTIDYLIRQDQIEPWPIHIGDHMTEEQHESLEIAGAGHPTGDDVQKRIDSENWHTVGLTPNDAVCYSGTHSWHYRSQRLKGTADLVFFHFVPITFEGPLS